MTNPIDHVPNTINKVFADFDLNLETGTPQSFIPSVARHAAAIIAAGAGLAAPLAYSQGSAATSPSEDQTATLNPFVVNVDKDHGFVAASSLAGGRLAGNLRDTPVAYSVLTRDFIEALQLTDVTEMTRWFTNAVDLPDNNASFDTGTSVRLSARGVSSELQRDFFPVSFNFDSYNVERLDLARGPNAILFGAGGAGGTINSVTKRARTDKRLFDLRTSYASWSNLRSTLDYNQTLGATLALRLNALYQDRAGWRDNETERRKGVTLAATWKLSRNTEIRAEAERGRMDKAVVVTTYRDQLSAWDGSTTVSVRGTALANSTGLSPYGAMIIFTPSNGLDTVYNYQGWSFSRGGNVSAAFPAGGTLVVGPSANIADAPINFGLNVPANLYANAIRGSNFRVPPREFSLYPDAPTFGVTNSNYTLSLMQRFGERFFVEAAGNVGKEDTYSDIGISRQMSRIYIDANSVLPSGRPNPNFKEPFTEANSWPYFQMRTRRNVRGSAGYRLDGTRWGDFGFNVLAGLSAEKFDRNAYHYVLKANADPRLWPTELPVNYRYYLFTDRERPFAKPDSWNYVNPITNSTSRVAAGNARDYQNTAFNQINENEYGYVQTAVNAKLLKGKLHLLAAARRDRFETHQESIVLQFDNPANWDGETRYLKPAAPADWSALTYRTRAANGTPFGSALPADTRPRIGSGLSSGQRDPLYASDRFRDDYSPPDQKGTVNTVSLGSVYHVHPRLSAFVNYAQSFTPPSVALRIDGSLFVPTASRGWDYGLRFASTKGEIVANLIRYAGRQDNRSIASTPFSQAFVQIIQANALNDLTPGGLNSRGLQLVPTGYVDTAAVKTEGWELEITANLNRNWRLMLNGALPRAFQENPNRETIAYYAKNEAVLKQIVTDAGGTINANNVATFNAVIPPGQSASEGPNAVAAWNTVQQGFAALASGQKLNRVTESSANLFTDYSFRDGLLRGFRLGGGLNYRGREVIGSRGAETIRNPSNPAAAIDNPAVSAYDMVYRKPYVSGTLAFNYTRKLGRKFTLGVDFKIDNLFDYSQPLYYNTVLRPPGGDLTNPARVPTPSQFAWLTPRNYTLSAALKF